MLASCVKLALVTGALGAFAVGDNGGDAATLIVRTHSLAGMVEPIGHLSGALTLLPFRISPNQEAPFIAEPAAAPLFPEDLCTLVRESIRPEFWDETPGARIDLIRNGLLICATQPVQDEVADLLANLTALYGPAETLELRAFAATEEDVARGAMPMDAAQADTLIAARGLQHSTSAALRGRAVVRGDSVDVSTVIYDYDTEIAQGTVAADPIVATVETGLRLMARSVRVEGGLVVSLVARVTDRAADDQVRRLDAKGMINAKPVMVERSAAGLLEHPRLAFASFAGDLFLPTGKAVWLPVTVTTHLGPVSFCLDLRTVGVAGPAHVAGAARNRGEAGSMRVDFWSGGAELLPTIEQEPFNAMLFDPGWTIEGSAPIWAHLEAGGDDACARLCDLATYAAGAAMESGIASVRTVGDYLRTDLPVADAERVASLLAQNTRFESALTVRGRFLRGEETIAAFRVPVVAGRPLSLWSGVEGTAIRRWDVDVANEAMAVSPAPEAWVDGFALGLTVSRNARAEFVVAARAKAAFLAGPPRPRELNDEARLVIDETSSSDLFVDEARTIPALGGRVRFGGDLALEITVEPASR